jgi:hypothetical protein
MVVMVHRGLEGTMLDPVTGGQLDRLCAIIPAWVRSSGLRGLPESRAGGILTG